MLGPGQATRVDQRPAQPRPADRRSRSPTARRAPSCRRPPRTRSSRATARARAAPPAPPRTSRATPAGQRERQRQPTTRTRRATERTASTRPRPTRRRRAARPTQPVRRDRASRRRRRRRRPARARRRRQACPRRTRPRLRRRSRRYLGITQKDITRRHRHVPDLGLDGSRPPTRARAARAAAGLRPGRSRSPQELGRRPARRWSRATCARAPPPLGCARAALPRPALAAPPPGPARQRRGPLDADARRAADPGRRHRAAVAARARASSRRQQEGAAGTRRGDRRPAPERRRPAAARLAGRGLLAPCRRSDAAVGPPEPARGARRRGRGTSRRAARPRSWRSRSGSELSAEVFKLPRGPRRSTSSCSRSPPSTTCRAEEKQVVLEEFWAIAQAQDFIVAGRHRVRQGRPRARARRREGARDHGPPVELHPASRRSSSCARSSRSRSTTSCRTSTRRRSRSC